MGSRCPTPVSGADAKGSSFVSKLMEQNHGKFDH